MGRWDGNVLDELSEQDTGGAQVLLGLDDIHIFHFMCVAVSMGDLRF